ncbi:MAG TPA: hypothetical protein VFD90_05695 [Gaiellales bacterium]|jgi:glucose-6-phosphate 1-dehydrogenase|nr:hypothetical protein [Gaiellales bacterium]
MATSAEPVVAVDAAAERENEPRVADVPVVFGITGDLAQIMTFRSLHLERRTLLESPLPVYPCAPGSWSPEAGASIMAGQSRRHGPWASP